MAENICTDLNLPEPARPRVQQVTDVQDKSCCSRKRVSVVVAVLIVINLVQFIVLCRIIMHHLTGCSPCNSTTQSPIPEKKPLDHSTVSSPQDSTTLHQVPKELPACPNQWEKHGRKCYFFPPYKEQDWNGSREECAAMGSDLVVIDSEDELVGSQSLELFQGCSRAKAEELHWGLLLWDVFGVSNLLPATDTPSWGWEQSPSEEDASWGFIYSFHKNPEGRVMILSKNGKLQPLEVWKELRYLTERSRYKYYFLGLTYSEREQKWRWINNMEHDPALFNIIGHFRGYHCTVIGFGKVETAPCGGSSTTENMCERAATMSER